MTRKLLFRASFTHKSIYLTTNIISIEYKLIIDKRGTGKKRIKRKICPKR